MPGSEPINPTWEKDKQEIEQHGLLEEERERVEKTQEVEPSIKPKNSISIFILLGFLMILFVCIFTFVKIYLPMRGSAYPQTIYVPLSDVALKQKVKDFYSANNSSIKLTLNNYGYVQSILLPISLVAATKSDYDLHNEPSDNMKHNVIAFIKKNSVLFGIGSDFSFPNRKWSINVAFTSGSGISAIQTFQVNKLYPQPLEEVFTGVPINQDADPSFQDHGGIRIILGPIYPEDFVITGHFWPSLNFPIHPKISENQIRSLYVDKTFDIHQYYGNSAATEKFKITSENVAIQLKPAFFIKNKSYELRLTYEVIIKSPAGLKLVKDEGNPYAYKANGAGIQLRDIIDAMTGEKLKDETGKYLK